MAFDLICLLLSTECVTEPDLTTITTVKMVLNMTVGVRTSSVQELPLMWSVIGYTAMGLTKISLSMLIVWVNKLFFMGIHMYKTNYDLMVDWVYSVLVMIYIFSLILSLRLKS